MKHYIMCWDGEPESLFLAPNDAAALQFVHEFYAKNTGRGTIRHISWKEIPPLGDWAHLELNVARIEAPEGAGDRVQWLREENARLVRELAHVTAERNEAQKQLNEQTDISLMWRDRLKEEFAIKAREGVAPANKGTIIHSDEDIG